MLNGATLLPTAANVKHAHKLAREVSSRIEHGTFSMAEYFPASGSGSPLTVGEQLDSWLEGQRIEASTRKSYDSAIRFWKAPEAGLGGMPIRQVRASHCLKAAASRPLISGKTLNNYVIVLRRALDLAVADKIIDENPAAHIERAEHQKPKPDPFTLEEVEAIVADAHKHYPGQAANFIEARFFTGVRTGEAFGLRWANVEAGRIRIAETVVGGLDKDSTKTNVSRDVLLNSRAAAAIKRQKEHTFLAGQHVFHDPRYGKRWKDERAFRRSFWSPILTRLGIRYRQPNNARHTYATLMLMNKMAPAFCAGQMGHSVEVFLSTYARWIPGAGDALEMDKLEAVLSKPRTTKEHKHG